MLRRELSPPTPFDFRSLGLAILFWVVTLSCPVFVLSFVYPL